MRIGEGVESAGKKERSLAVGCLLLLCLVGVFVVGVRELFFPPRFRYSSNQSISADGRYVAFESWTHTKSPMGTPTSPSDIFVHDRQTGQTTRVSVATSTPIATGPGGWIASISDRDGNPEIYKMRADGSQVTRLTDSSALDWWPSWGP